MSDKVPIYRQISYVGLAVIFVVTAGAAALGWYLTDSIYGGLVGVMAVVIYAWASRKALVNDHQEGLDKVQLGKFDEAIQAYDRSLDFLKRNPWVDHFRFLTILSASTMTYREMALVSQAYCYIQLKQTKKAREIYELCLAEYPNNILAASALRFMDAVKDEARNS